MRYTVYFNQQRMIEWDLNANLAALVSTLNQVHTWAEMSVIDGQAFFWVSRQRVMEELPGFFTKEDTVYRAFKSLAERGLLVYSKQGVKDMIRLTEKIKLWNVANDGNALGNKSDTRKQIRKSSEINPNLLGNKSDILDTTRLYTTRLDKEAKASMSDTSDEPSHTQQMKKIMEAWNNTPFTSIKSITADTARGKSLSARIKKYSWEAIIEAIEIATKSEFLLGSKGWVMTFDWFIKPNNFLKVLEGTYTNQTIDPNLGGRNEFNQRDYRKPSPAERVKEDLRGSRAQQSSTIIDGEVIRPACGV